MNIEGYTVVTIKRVHCEITKNVHPLPYIICDS